MKREPISRFHVIHDAKASAQMAREVIGREQALKQQVQALRIEIGAEKRAREVAESAGSDYFRTLKKRA